MDNFTPINTQEELNAVIGERITKAKEATRKEFEGWKSPEVVEKEKTDLTSELNEKLKEKEGLLEAANKEVEEAKAKIAEKDGIIKKHESDSVKTRVAHETGLSYEAIEFLKGENEEEIKASAEKLKKMSAGGGAPSFSTEPGGDDNSTRNGEREALKKLRADLMGE